MVTTTINPQERRPSLDIRLRGRTYPLSCRNRLTVPVDDPPDVPSVEDRLRHRILAMLSFPTRTEPEFPKGSDVVRAFGTDMVLLEAMAQQWHDFLDQLKRLNLQTTFARNAPQKEQRKAIDKALALMGHSSSAMVHDEGVLNTDLLEQPLPVVHGTLQSVLNKAVDRFIRVMRSDLEQLGDLRVVGLLEWTGDTTCSFHFYEHLLDVTVDSNRTDEVRFPVQRKGRAPKMGREILQTLAGRHIHRVTRQEELLMDATAKPVDDPDLILPARVQKLLKTCPPWLRPELEVVEGEKCREEYVELLRVESEWQEQWSKQKIMPHFDPALTLFNEFVLMGWDDKLHEGEIHRRVHNNNERLQAQTTSQPTDEHSMTMDRDLEALVGYGILCVLVIATGCSLGRPFAAVACLLCGLTVPGVVRLLRSVRYRSQTLTEELQYAMIGTWLFGLMAAGMLAGWMMTGSSRFGQVSALTFLIACAGGIVTGMLLKKQSDTTKGASP